MSMEKQPLLDAKDAPLTTSMDQAVMLVDPSFHTSLKSKRTASVAVGTLVNLAAGTLYAFSVFGPAIKDSMGYSQTQLNFIGAAGNFGSFALAIPKGMFFDAFGSRRTLQLGAVLTCCSYLSVAGLLAMESEKTPASLFAFLFMAIGLGSGCGYFSAVLTNVKNFPPSRRGRVSGLLVGFYGLSAAFTVMIYNWWFAKSENTIGYLLFLAGFTFCANSLGAEVLEALPPKWAQSEHSLGHNPPYDQKFPPLTPSGDYEEGVSGWDLLSNRTFLRFWTLELCLAGSCLTYIANLGNMNESIGAFDNRVRAVLLLSICNATGRLLFGLSSDLTLKYGIHRLAWVSGVAALMSVTFGVLAGGVGTPLGLNIASAVIGLGFGGASALLPANISELFGLKHVGFNLGCVAMSLAVGSYIFGTIAGLVYDGNRDEGSIICTGDQCFSGAFWAMAAGTAFSSALALYMAITLQPSTKKNVGK